MGFRDDFVSGYMLTPVGPRQRSFAQWSLEKTVDSGMRSNEKQAQRLAENLRSAFQAGISQLQDSQMQSAKLLQREIQYQSDHIIDAISQGLSDVVAAVQNACDYLGGQLCEVRWAIERHTKVSERILETLLNSLGNTSRQYYEQGVKWYEDSEYDLAKERFLLALKDNSRNYFAYQYLGFIAVHGNEGQDALRNFDLARKAAEDGYHKALALSHLARSQNATGDISKAVESSVAATEAAPNHAKFWYESSVFHVRADQFDEAIKSLRRAVQTDLNYWSISISDASLDAIRERVEALFSDIREQKRVVSRRALDKLAATVALLKDIEIPLETEDNAKLQEFDTSYLRGTVFDHDRLPAQVRDAERCILRSASKSIIERIQANRTALTRLRSLNAGSQSQMLTQIAELKRSLEAVPESHKSRLIFTGCLSIVGFMVAFFSLAVSASNRDIGAWGFWIGLLIFCGCLVWMTLMNKLSPSARKWRAELLRLQSEYATRKVEIDERVSRESAHLEAVYKSLLLNQTRLQSLTSNLS